MNDIYTLNNVPVGEEITVLSINNNGILRRRLFDIGIVKGAKVKCVGQSMFGDPKAYNICGAIIALRNCDSADITVAKESAEV